MADNKTIGRLSTMVCSPADHKVSGSSPVQQRLDQLGSQYADHVSGRNPLPPEQSLWLRGEIDRLSQIVHPGQQSLWPAYSPLERQYLAQQAAQHDHDANTLGMALLGPVFGGPAAAARNLGAPESVVSGLNEFGFGVAGAVALGGIGRGDAVRSGLLFESAVSAVKPSTNIVTIGNKSVPSVRGSGVVVAKRVVVFSTKQLERKFKHASDFGVSNSRKNPKTIAEYKLALEDHLGDPATRNHGSYLYVSDSMVAFNPISNNVIVLDAGGNFVTGWKLTPGTPQYKNYLANGVLR